MLQINRSQNLVIAGMKAEINTVQSEVVYLENA
jgi:hypothetical protein